MAIRGRSGPLVTLRRQPIPKLLVVVDDPTGAIVVPALGANITLNWTASPTSGVTAYSIFRRTGVTGVAFVPGVDTPIATGVAALTYTDSGLSSGTYEYQVFGEVGAPAWTPAALSPLGWYDPSNASTVHASGGNITSLDDLSGHGYTLTVGPGGSGPGTGTHTIGGLNALWYVGGHYLINSTMNTNINNITVVAVVRLLLNDPRSICSGGPDNFSFAIDSSYQRVTISDASGLTDRGDTGVDLVTAHALSFTKTRSSYALYFDGDPDGVGSDAMSWHGGAGFVIGTNSLTAPGNAILADIGELLIFDTILSHNDRALLASYLATKWGTPTPSFPTTLSGVTAWYDSSELLSITASSGSVSQWADVSGSGYHVVQPTGANQPVTGTRTLNGKNVLDFGGNNFFNQNDISPNLAQPLTVLAVLASDNVDSGNRQFLGNFSGTQPTMFVNADTWRMYDGTEINTGQAETSASVQVVGVFNGSSSEYYFNGTQIATGVNPGTNPLDTISIGHDGGGAFFMWDGTIAELIILDHAITSTERTAWNAYVTAKWGI